jgi:hypothetical protein
MSSLGSDLYTVTSIADNSIYTEFWITSNVGDNGVWCIQLPYDYGAYLYAGSNGN